MIITSFNDSKNVKRFIKESKIILVARNLGLNHMKNIIEAVYRGGIRVIEITMDNTEASLIIKTINESFCDILVGAGTVLEMGKALEAIGAGAKFLVSPIFDKKIVDLAKLKNITVIPGAMTPTEVYFANKYGVDMIKIFPARILTSKYIKDLTGPFGMLDIMVTGGITTENILDFLNAGVSAFGIGKDILDENAIKKGDYNIIEEKAKHYVNLVKKFNS
ncbi:MAG: bifunctional 4-hydroxy-2-oxoglutarate aldolase/2-dehydro-3-deoxy-phosphogluconate aldolase [Actinobacteria bacterium]|nr:bifunctional 4-hydroxy-2-oxoglutarate aldolase/2-dehydro-3-deoxy-phosphogluconate aldolase [Actinomycetota bacterium]